MVGPGSEAIGNVPAPMTFNSVEYAVFLSAVLLVYWRLPRRPQNLLLLAASYVFYGWWDVRFLGLLVLSTLLDWVIARRLGATEHDRARKRWLGLSMASNLGILGFFKYWGFFVESGTEVLEALGVDWAAPTLQVVLPVGISFYTFQSMSYVIDVYRRRIEPSPSLVEFATYVAFFPQLVAGPIERAEHLLPQYGRARACPDRDAVESALALILLGLVRKVVIADTLAPIVADGYAPGATGGAALLAFYGFAFQVYGDFAGYSAIARGSARLLGFELMVNFDAPYRSPNPTVFWRRWHISLSTWLRDYLYVPLGGNRRGMGRQLVNLLLVMLIGGLWHGASWTFVVWGGIHGLLLVGHRLWMLRRPQPPARWSHPLRVLLMFHAALVAWVFFRAPSFTAASDLFAALANPLQGLEAGPVALLVAAAAASTLLDRLVVAGGDEAHLVRLAPVGQGLALGAALVALVVYAGGTPVPFIYFQF